MKMLCGNLLTYGQKFEQSGLGSPHCRLCDSSHESISHIVASCPQFEDIRKNILIEFDEVLAESKNKVKIKDFQHSDEILTQFILDPTSLNLPQRIHLNDPIVERLFKLSRDICFSINKKRVRLLKEKVDKISKTK